MKDLSVFKNYYFFAELIEKIANSSPYEKLTVRGLGISSARIKKGYEEIKRLNFPGQLIDFICWVSFDRLVSILKESWDKNKKEKDVFFNMLTVVLENDYKNSKRLLAVNPAILNFALKRMSFSSKKDRKAFGKWIRPLF